MIAQLLLFKSLNMRLELLYFASGRLSQVISPSLAWPDHYFSAVGYCLQYKSISAHSKKGLIYFQYYLSQQPIYILGFIVDSSGFHNLNSTFNAVRNPIVSHTGICKFDLTEQSGSKSPLISNFYINLEKDCF